MKQSYQAVAVLGKGILPDGTLPPISQHEMDYAIRCIRQQQANYLICSGKYSVFIDSAGPRTEAKAMQHYALQQGIAPEQIIIEEKSVDTITNLVNVAKICQQKNLMSVLIVSNAEHLRRIEWIAKQVFPQSIQFYFHGHNHSMRGWQYHRLLIREQLSLWYAYGLFFYFHHQSKWTLLLFISKKHLVYRSWFAQLGKWVIGPKL